MRSVALAEALEYARAGYWGGEPGSANTDVAVIRNGDIKSDGVQWDSLPLRALKTSEIEKSAVASGDILLTTSGDCGQVAMVADAPPRPTCVTNFVRILRFDRSQVDPRYAFHYLASAAFRATIAPYIRGTTLKNLSTRPAFSNARIPLPAIAEQWRVAAILDHASAIVVQQRQALARLDRLAGSIFRELFRDEPSEDTVEALAIRIRTGPFGSQLLHSEFVDEGISVLGLDNVVDNEFRWAARRYITREKYEKLGRYTVSPGDVLVSIMGTTGRCAVVPRDIPVAINTKHLCAITADQARLEPEFLHAAFLYHPQSRAYLRRQTKGSIMDGLNMGIIKSMPVPTPSLSRQRDFANQIHGVSDRREALRRRLTASIELFASLQARAFRGEL